MWKFWSVRSPFYESTSFGSGGLGPPTGGVGNPPASAPSPNPGPAAGGTGSGPAPNTGSGQPQGTQGQGTGQAQSTQPAGNSPIALTADSMVIPPGQTTPIRYGDYLARHSQAEQLLIQRANELDARQRQMQAQGQGQAPDPFAEIRDQPIVDGRMIEALYRQGFSPIVQQMQQQAQQIAEMRGTIQRMTGIVQPLASNHVDQQLQSRLTGAVSALGLPQLPAGTEGLDVLQELAHDLYGSHEDNADLQQQLPSMLKTRFEKIRKLVYAVDRAEAQARVNQPRFAPVVGGAQQRPAPLSNSEIANRVFAVPSAT